MMREDQGVAWAPQYSKNVDASQAGANLRLSAAWLAHFQTKLSGMSEEGAGKGLEVQQLCYKNCP